MSDQDNGQVSTLQRPTTDDREAWKTYWTAKGWRWRIEPEIDAERQKYLEERRKITPDIEKGVYPFKDIKLSRADVEWLLATHENGRGPVDTNDKNQRKRKGLDLRGANLHHANLQNLPLARLLGALTWHEGPNLTSEQRRAAEIFLEGANLKQAHLEDAILTGVHLENAEVERINLKGAYLIRVHLEGASLNEANLERSNLTGAYMEGAFLRRVHLGDENYIGPRLVDTQWGNTNLAIVNWAQVKLLDDEYRAKQKKQDGQLKERAIRINEYEKAVRANRQLAVTLQAQGLNENAARFAYRAQLCQRIILRLQKKFGQYFFSLLLDLLAGYGYRPGRSVLWYLAVIFGFALAYFVIGHLPFFPDAFVFSLTSFHGRGFFPGLGNEASLHNPLVVTAAFEAVIGLLIEISFIATFTQRFFGR